MNNKKEVNRLINRAKFKECGSLNYLGVGFAGIESVFIEVEKGMGRLAIRIQDDKSPHPARIAQNYVNALFSDAEEMGVEITYANADAENGQCFHIRLNPSQERDAQLEWLFDRLFPPRLADNVVTPREDFLENEGLKGRAVFQAHRGTIHIDCNDYAFGREGKGLISLEGETRISCAALLVGLNGGLEQRGVEGVAFYLGEENSINVHFTKPIRDDEDRKARLGAVYDTVSAAVESIGRPRGRPDEDSPEEWLR